MWDCADSRVIGLRTGLEQEALLTMSAADCATCAHKPLPPNVRCQARTRDWDRRLSCRSSTSGTWYCNWYRSQRTEAHPTVRKRRRNAAPVLRWALISRPSKPVRSCSPRLGRFDSGAAPLSETRCRERHPAPRGVPAREPRSRRRRCWRGPDAHRDRRATGARCLHRAHERQKVGVQAAASIASFGDTRLRSLRTRSCGRRCAWHGCCAGTGCRPRPCGLRRAPAPEHQHGGEDRCEPAQLVFRQALPRSLRRYDVALQLSEPQGFLECCTLLVAIAR
jgi:hypothetical protein